MPGVLLGVFLKGDQTRQRSNHASDTSNINTEEKILEAMFKMEELGINTMLPLADPFVIRVLSHYRNNGGKMNFIFTYVFVYIGINN